MPKYAVFFELFFVPHYPDEVYIDSDDVDVQNEILQARAHSFDYTSNNIGDIMEYVQSFPAEDFAENFIGLYDIEPETAKWHKTDGKTTFSFQITTDDTVEEIISQYLHDSLEDGPYEGEDNGMVIMTLDKKYEFGLIDYRANENIAVIPVVI
jgi:hypothetical protein